MVQVTKTFAIGAKIETCQKLKIITGSVKLRAANVIDKAVLISIVLGTK